MPVTHSRVQLDEKHVAENHNSDLICEQLALVSWPPLNADELRFAQVRSVPVFTGTEYSVMIASSNSPLVTEQDPLLPSR